jgi:hypothetical protein
VAARCLTCGVTDDATTPRDGDRAAASDADQGTAHAVPGAGSTGPATPPTDATPGPGDAAGRDAAESGPTSDATGPAAETTGAAADASGPAADTTGPAEDANRPASSRRRRWWIAGGIALAAVVVLVTCAGAATLAIGMGRLFRHADETVRDGVRSQNACLELEERLNRLTPPGAATDPGERAAAIRDENTAVAPFLAELNQAGGARHRDRDDDDRGDGRGWADGWRQLVAARTAYADALDRQATGREPAFFVAPQTRGGTPVLDRLERGPESCAGVVRRLAAPDL